MKYRQFGRMGWKVSEIGYGMWGMGEWTGSDDEQSLRSLQKAIDLGCNFFDTAWAYGEGTAKACWERSCAQIRKRHFTPQPRSLQRTASGPAGGNSRWMIVSRLTTLKNMYTAAWRTRALKNSTWCNSMCGRITSLRTRAG